MNNKFAVIGLGLFGTSIARKLAAQGAEVLAIDSDINMVEDIKDDVAYAVALDATDEKALKAQNIGEMDAVVVAIGENFQGLLLATVQLMEMKVKRIIARAANEQQKMILTKMGVKEILSPEDTVGKSVAERLLHPNVRTFLDLGDNYEIIEISTPQRLVNQTLKEAELREKYELNLVSIKRSFEEGKNEEAKKVERLIGVPKADTVILESDILILLGKSDDLKRFMEVNK